MIEYIWEVLFILRLHLSGFKEEKDSPLGLLGVVVYLRMSEVGSLEYRRYFYFIQQLQIF